MSNILVIDNDQEILNVLDVLLSTKGLKVKTQSRYEKTFNEIVSFEPDLIVMDIDLGNEDGRIITRQIKSSKTTDHIPVILLSGIKDIDKKLDDCLNDDFISKPFEANNLFDKIDFHLQKKLSSKSLDIDYCLLEQMIYDPVHSIDILYEKYAPALFAYLLSVVKDTAKSEEILIGIFKELVENPQLSKKESLLLMFIKKANKRIAAVPGKGRKFILARMKNFKQIQNN